MTEVQWDKKLKIKTTGRTDAHADPMHHPYEPTPYAVLERLAESGYIRKESRVLDYGCGRGRVGFFLRHRLNCACLGVEYNEALYLQALENRTSCGLEVSFVCAAAETYAVGEEDCFYFFNPFSVTLLCAVMERIRQSFYTAPRRLRLFFYYPDDAYLSYLLSEPDLTFCDEIPCGDLFEGRDGRERIVVFEMKNYFEGEE